jgi:hypothetical protein
MLNYQRVFYPLPHKTSPSNRLLKPRWISNKFGHCSGIAKRVSVFNEHNQIGLVVLLKFPKIHWVSAIHFYRIGSSNTSPTNSKFPGLSA